VDRKSVTAAPEAESGPASGPTAEQAGHGLPAGTAGEAARHMDARELEEALLTLRERIAAAPLLLDAPGVAQAKAVRKKLLVQIDDYLLPRLHRSTAPILVALVGSTGAGKSTLVNSIVGQRVSATGIRRPTTNSPVLACHPDDAGWFAENRFLPTLPRVRQEGLARPGRDGLLVIAASEGLPRGIALLDTPDIDSVVRAHYEFAHQFLDASDLWLFVTTAARYADASVWELLQYAKERGAALGIVLSRVPEAGHSELVGHFCAMLEANGVGEADRFVIPETVVTEGMLPAEVFAPVRSWLEEAAVSEDRRVAVLAQTMSGVLDTFRARVPELAAQVEAQVALRVELQGLVEGAYDAAVASLEDAIKNGSLLRGEVLARWQDFAGTGELLRTLQVRHSYGPGQPSRKRRNSARLRALKAALRSSLESLIVSLGNRAAEQAAALWRDHPAGAALLASLDRGADGVMAGHDGQYDQGLLLSESSPGLARRAAHAVSAWQDHVLHLVQAEGAAKRSVARVVSFDDESLAVLLMIDSIGYGKGDATTAEDAAANSAGHAAVSGSAGDPGRGSAGDPWIGPAHAKHASGDHGRTEPAGAGHGSTGPVGNGAAAADPSAAEPVGGRDPAGRDPAGGDPAGGDPAGGDPAGGDPAGGDPAGGDPAGGDPAGGDPAGGDPAGGDPAGGDPAGGDPAGGVPRRLLDSLLGPGPVRAMGVKVHGDLHNRLSLLFAEEMLRFVQLADAAGVPDGDAAAHLYQATRFLEHAR
jgi:50S ribosome-binding GTPase